MCGGVNVEVLENFCKNEAGIDDETRDDSVERVPYRGETTVSDEGNRCREETTVSNEGDAYRDETYVSDETDPHRSETTVPNRRDAYSVEANISNEGDTYRSESTVPNGRDAVRAEANISHEGDTNRGETTVPNGRDAYRDERTVSHETFLNPNSEYSDNKTSKKKRVFSILDIGDCFSDSSQTEDMSQYTPILFPRKETTNDVTTSESSSDSDELEDVYGDIVFRRNERHKPNEKVDVLKIDPKSFPYRISNRVKKQSKFLTEDNIDKEILDQNLKRLRGILLKSREAKLKKAEFSKHLVKEESEEYSNEILNTDASKNGSCIPNVQLKPCSIVLERLNISSDMAMIKPCSIVLKRLNISTVVVSSHNNRDGKEISHIVRKRPKKQIAKPSAISRSLRSSVLAAKQGRYCTRSSNNHNKTRRRWC